MPPSERRKEPASDSILATNWSARRAVQPSGPRSTPVTSSAHPHPAPEAPRAMQAPNASGPTAMVILRARNWPGEPYGLATTMVSLGAARERIHAPKKLMLTATDMRTAIMVVLIS